MVLAVAKAVAVAATPDVSWFPAALTPGKFIEAEPLKDTPPISRAVSRVVADVALPVTAPVTFPATLPSTFPTIVPVT